MYTICLLFMLGEVMKKSVIYGIMSLATMSGFALEGCSPWQMCGEQLSHAPSIQLDMHLQASEEQTSHVPCTPEEPWFLNEEVLDFEKEEPWVLNEEELDFEEALPLPQFSHMEPVMQHPVNIEEECPLPKTSDTPARPVPSWHRRIIQDIKNHRPLSLESLFRNEEDKLDSDIIEKFKQENDERFCKFDYIFNPKLSREVPILKAVLIPSHVKYIANSAFLNEHQLEKVEFQDIGCQVIGFRAFEGTGIHKISLPPSVQILHMYCFACCPNLKAVEYSADSELKYIAPYAFSDSPVQFFGNTEMASCEEALASIPPQTLVRPHAFSVIKSFGDVTSMRIATIFVPASISRIEKGAFKGLPQLTTVVIPDDTQLTVIDDWAFAKTPLLSHFGAPGSENQLLAANLSRIGCNAFARSGLPNITLPGNLALIDSYAFYSCRNLTSCEWIEGPSPQPCTIGEFAFAATGLKTYTLHPMTKKLGYKCFANSQLKKVNAAENQLLTAIPASAFSYCDSLQEVDLSQCVNLQYLAEYAFAETQSLTIVSLPATSIRIEGGCFWLEAYSDQSDQIQGALQVPLTTGTYLSIDPFENDRAIDYLRETHVAGVWKDEDTCTLHNKDTIEAIKSEQNRLYPTKFTSTSNQADEDNIILQILSNTPLEQVRDEQTFATILKGIAERFSQTTTYEKNEDEMADEKIAHLEARFCGTGQSDYKPM